MSPIKIYAGHYGDAYVVRVRGKLDLAGCPALERALKVAEGSDVERIFLDLEDLTFMDVRGANTIKRAAHRSASQGSRLQISRGNARVAWVFHLLGLEASLPFSDASLVPEPDLLEDSRAAVEQWRGGSVWVVAGSGIA
jgi:anti-anti-sigma factor